MVCCGLTSFRCAVTTTRIGGHAGKTFLKSTRGHIGNALVMRIRIPSITHGSHEHNAQSASEYEQNSVKHTKKDGIIRAPQKEIPRGRGCDHFLRAVT